MDGPGLGQEVLHDDFLDVAEAGVRRGDGPQGRHLAGPVVADADQDPGGERDVQLAGGIERGQAAGRVLVGGAAVGLEVGGQGLDHHALAGRDRAQLRQLVGVEGAGIGVGEEAGLLQDEATGVGEVVHRRGEPVVVEPLAGQRVPQLGALAQGEERLVAPGRLAGPGDGQDLLGRADRARSHGPGPWRTCSSRSGRGTAW